MLRWKELYEECLNCHKCSLGDSKINMVFGDGNSKADIIFIGEAPGADEDRTGIPFVGRAGQLLTKYLQDIELYRNKDYYICNICKCRPEKNRTPDEDEAQACIQYLRNQVALVKPKIIVCLGATAMKYVLGSDWRITRDRGKWVEKKGFYMTTTFHPSAILRDPSKNEPFLDDLKAIKRKYEEISK